jgi:hypothetical protein
MEIMMPEISNPQLKDYCNGSLRVIADKLAEIDRDIAVIQEEYHAKNLGTVINDAGSSNLIADGSETDGRTRLTGGDVYNMVTLLSDLQGFVTEGRRDVIAKWQVNGYRPS